MLINERGRLREDTLRKMPVTTIDLICRRCLPYHPAVSLFHAEDDTMGLKRLLEEIALPTRRINNV
jgi:hypothetical protein